MPSLRGHIDAHLNPSVQLYLDRVVSSTHHRRSLRSKFLATHSYGLHTHYSSLFGVRAAHFLLGHRLPVVICASLLN